jgi:ATP-binding cassette subfamily B protein
VEEEVERLPNRYDTMLGERGVNLSGGQKQRVSLARAVASGRPILILDDAFASVDTHTEERILRGLREVMKERTTILISHRISTVQLADEIIVLEEGRIAEQGTHAELLEKGGLYYEIYERQLREEAVEEANGQ